MINNKLFLVLLALTISVITSLFAQNLLEELQSRLMQIRTYEYGQSRENLTAINNLLRKIGNTNDLLEKAEEQLIDFLESDATLAAKQFVCEGLSIYGSDESVSVLEEMLFESNTENMALFALERIPTEDAGEVLKDALSDTKGDLKVGIINALGDRGVKDAIEEISQLIWDLDSQIASAAISATGKIGGDNATKVLNKAMSDPNVILKVEVIFAYLRCAVDYEENRENKKALIIYQSLNKPEYDNQVRHAALRGIISTSGQKATDVIVTFFDNESPDKYSIVIPLVQEIPDSEDVTPIVGQLLKLKSTDQVKLLGALAGRKEPTVVKAMVKLTKSSNDQVRIAALNALSMSGDAETVLLFVGIAAGRKGMERIAARNGIDRLNAPGTDELIMKSIPVSEDSRKIELIRSTSSRYLSSASSLLIGELQSPNVEVRIASIKSLKEIATPEYLDALIQYHMKTKNDQELSELENTIVVIIKRIPDNQSRTDKLITNFDKLNNIKHKSSYLKMMGRLGDQQSLSILRDGLRSDNEELKSSAIRGISNWPDSEPASELLTIAKSSKNQIHRVLAIRGYVGLVDRDDNIKSSDKLKMYEEVMQLEISVADKRLVLSCIENIPTLESFNYVTGFLDNQEVKSEAEIAVFKIVRGLDDRPLEMVLPILKKIRDQTQNKELLQEVSQMIYYMEENVE
jgi:HEAT repeat protein